MVFKIKTLLCLWSGRDTASSRRDQNGLGGLIHIPKPHIIKDYHYPWWWKHITIPPCDPGQKTTMSEYPTNRSYDIIKNMWKGQIKMGREQMWYNSTGGNHYCNNTKSHFCNMFHYSSTESFSSQYRFSPEGYTVHQSVPRLILVPGLPGRSPSQPQ